MRMHLQVNRPILIIVYESYMLSHSRFEVPFSSNIFMQSIGSYLQATFRGMSRELKTLIGIYDCSRMTSKKWLPERKLCKSTDVASTRYESMYGCSITVLRPKRKVNL